MTDLPKTEAVPVTLVRLGAWMPIDLAPKDGTRILGFGQWAGEINGPSKEMTTAIIRWGGGHGDYPGFDWDVEGTDAYAAWMKPTHFMPLPDPP